MVGDDDHPKVRLPAAGGAPEIAASRGEVIVVMRQSARAFVERVVGVVVGGGGGEREQLGLRGRARDG